MTWEYLVRRGVLMNSADMDKLGRQGWELVAVIGDHEGRLREYIFKRSRAEKEERL